MAPLNGIEWYCGPLPGVSSGIDPLSGVSSGIELLFHWDLKWYSVALLQRQVSEWY